MTKQTHILLCLGGISLAAILLFLGWNLHGNLAFVLPFRLKKIAMICLVACSVSTATVLFQTISTNRILTPGIMGYDGLFLLLRTLIFALPGASAFSAQNPTASFILNAFFMTVLSCLLYRHLFRGSHSSLHLMILTGVVLSALFRSLTNFIQSLIDPNTFLILQNSLFANFNNPDASMLLIAALTVTATLFLVARSRFELDVLALGRDAAISLGVPYRSAATRALMLIAVLVSVSTSLVGPVTFFGLLTTHIAYRLLPAHRHAALIPAATSIAIGILLIGQLILERLLAFSTALSVVVEFTGGILFLILLLKGSTR